MTTSAFRSTLERGIVAHREGRLGDAVVAYRAALELQPSDAETTSLLGLAIVQSGRSTEGMALLEKGTTLAPTQAGLLFNLAEGLALAGEFEAALATYRRTLELQPNSSAAWARCGELESKLGNVAAATHAWAEALEIDPTAVRPALKLAELATRHGDTDKAISLLEIALSLHPTHDELLDMLCEVLATRRDWAKLATTARAWADAQPQLAAPWKHLSRAAFEYGRFKDAVEGYSNFLMRGQHGVSDLAAYAGLCLHAHDFEAAEAALVAAEEIDASHPGVLARRALLHMYYGRFDQAADAARRCLEIEPDNAYVFSILSRLQQGKLDPSQIARLESIAAREDAPFDFRIPAAFAIAHAYDAQEILDLAFDAYTRAHALALDRDKVENRSYNREGQEQRTQRLCELFTGSSTLVGREDEIKKAVSRRPIFILGLPRTGSTLVESLLGAHPRVHACGERGAMQRLLGNYISLIEENRAPPSSDLLTKWATAYLAEPHTPPGRDVITDKQPLNFHAIGLILKLFPDAVILHLRRHPLETLWSIWRQEFGKSWAFTHQFEDLAHYYGEYLKLMTHWDRAFPGRIVTLRYEDIVSGFPGSAKSLIEVCGLDWRDDVLNFAQQDRPIATFSTVAVRDPIALRNTHVNRYRSKLAPLVAALQGLGIDPERGDFV